MNWDQLLSAKRFTSTARPEDIRSQFQRDFDRIIFSSPFRRLQNKTQVFPLPGSVFVHNRLTHSLEVSSVGRSLANLVSQTLLKREDLRNTISLTELGSIVAAACLAHDLGNPPFGHSGEKAISKYFSEGKGKIFEAQLSPEQWSDLVSFEGNANAFRILTHQFNGRRNGGFALTYATLAALVKYPYPSFPTSISKKKYGFFFSETETFINIAVECGIPAIDKEKNIYARHPLVYLVEAADDISYLIMDIEDAHKLGILKTSETENLLLSFFNEKEHAKFLSYKEEVYREVTDINERIAFLRASTINVLVQQASSLFIKHYDTIMSGHFNSSLVKQLEGHYQIALDNCRKQSIKWIYNHPSVIKIELTGYNVLGTLMDEFSSAILNPHESYNEKLLSLLPAQFQTASDDLYRKLQSVVDFISGMTDLYALQLYKDLKGIV
ncbi:MAG: deoxyguanosinetriphosphate triphosphohydrolase [Bacteroidetes bacterium HGW-Bacteroidetes-1]|jgi:dGTPase|nr:MAG: deoxyguanosinetriphosphate triphosphohydrolase [Bacteroidetes bacterium HGW-Bacteroidetes-1]